MSDDVLIGLLVLNAAALTLTAALTWRTRRFLTRAVRTSGRIAEITMELHEWASHGSDHPAETVSHFTPFVEFTGEGGSTVRFRSRVSHPRSSLYREGQVVDVVYERTDPAGTAEIAGPAVWRSVVFSAIGSSVLLLFTVFAKACA